MSVAGQETIKSWGLLTVSQGIYIQHEVEGEIGLESYSICKLHQALFLLLFLGVAV